MALGSKKASFAGDSFGNLAPLLQGVPLLSNEVATGAAALQVHNNDGIQFVRLFALGCDLYYTFGGSSIALPTAADLLMLNGQTMDTYLSGTQQYVRAVAKSGSGSLRVELLG